MDIGLSEYCIWTVFFFVVQKNIMHLFGWRTSLILADRDRNLPSRILSRNHTNEICTL